MNPYDAPNTQPRTNVRRIWFGLAITFLILLGIVTTLVLGNWARAQARRDRSTGNFRRYGPVLKSQAKDFKLEDTQSPKETP